MTIAEWWCEYDRNQPQDDKKYAGKLTRGDVDELLTWLDERAVADGNAGSKG